MTDKRSWPNWAKDLMPTEASGGIVLMVAAALAIAMANSSLADLYHDIFHHVLPWTPVAKLDTLHLWINDALMAVFFFAVGLEVKHEVLAGELSTPAQRRLPVLAAAAGMIFPAGLYLLLASSDGRLMHGWAIPAATDIAFAMGVIGLLGTRVPRSLRLFLLTVAIVDDIGAVLIIALFYTSGIDFGWLTAAFLVLCAMFAANRMKVKKSWVFALLTLPLWYAVLQSGIHATIAGVVAAFAIPLDESEGPSMVERMEHDLSGWNSFLIVPIFGFANAGVSFAGMGLDGLLAPLPLAIAAGLFLGKQVGIFASIFAAERIGFAKRPEGTTMMQVYGMAILCGIGFTMSLFITALAFPHYPALAEEAKLGVLGGSLLSAILGYAVLRFAPQPKAQPG